MSETTACLIAAVSAMLLITVMFFGASKAHCRKGEKCGRAAREIKEAPPGSKLGAIVLHLPLIFQMNAKAFALAMSGVLVEVVGFVCGFSWIAALIENIQYIFRILFPNNQEPSP